MPFESKVSNYIINIITFVDGVSIFFIVLFHEMAGINRIDSLFLVKYLAIFGLVLFTFSSGFKFGLNHSKEISEKSFIKSYCKKRLIRLYKTYIGYTLLAFIPMYFISYIVNNYLKLNFIGIDLFTNNLNINGLFKIILGENIISYQLWYLVALIVITFVCFTILYYLNINCLFFFYIPIIIFDIIFLENLKNFHNILLSIFVYMPTYICGIYYGYKELDRNKLSLSYIISLTFIVLFSFSIIYPHLYIFKYDILLYGFTLPPFIFLLSKSLLKISCFTELFMRCGKYSFQIYLFHWPIILPFFSRFIIDILKINNFFIPYLITIFSIISCIYMYKLTKMLKLNKLFE